MDIHVCRRCEGCGHLTGAFRWEIPWTRWAPDAAPEAGVLPPQVCPDCGGTGALIQFEEAEPVTGLPSRRGLRPANPYAQHVSLVLHSQSMGPART